MNEAFERARANLDKIDGFSGYDGQRTGPRTDAELAVIKYVQRSFEEFQESNADAQLLKNRYGIILHKVQFLRPPASPDTTCPAAVVVAGWRLRKAPVYLRVGEREFDVPTNDLPHRLGVGVIVFSTANVTAEDTDRVVANACAGVLDNQKSWTFDF